MQHIHMGRVGHRHGHAHGHETDLCKMSIVDAYLSTVDQTTNTIFYMALTKINQQS